MKEVFHMNVQIIPAYGHIVDFLERSNCTDQEPEILERFEFVLQF